MREEVRPACPLLVVLACLASVAACGPSPGSPAAEPIPPDPVPSPVPAPSCRMDGRVTAEGDAPLPGQAVRAFASEAVREGLWREVARAEVVAGPDGGFDLSLPCGALVRLEFPGWTWPMHPDDLLAEPAAAPLDVRLAPERIARLWVTDAEGKRVSATFARSGGGVAVPVPWEGLVVEGIPYGEVAGTLRAEGFLPRAWRLGRSDELHEVAPSRYEASVRLGAGAPFWVVVPPEEVVDVSGAWCLSGGLRGDPCRLRDGAWHCACDGSSGVAIASTRWDVGIVRSPRDGDVDFAALPGRVEQCLSAGSEGTLRIQPAGVQDVLLLGVRRHASRACLALPQGEPIDAILESDVGLARSFRHVAIQPGDVVLR